MLMEIKQLKNTNQWSDFLVKQTFSPFVQAPAYADFYAYMDEKSWIFGIFDDNILVGGSLVVGTHAKRGNYLYLPYGPILPDVNTVQALEKLKNNLLDLAKSEGMDFVRISPFIDNTRENELLYKNSNFRPAPMHVLAENTWLLDISDNKEVLLSKMKKNHRNLIRRCEREGVKINIKIDNTGLKQFGKLFDETVKKHNFHRFSDKYINNEFTAFAKKRSAIYIEAYLPNGQLDAAAIFMFYGNMACYRHSASLNLDKKLPTSYLIQWSAILEAKKRGIKWYNFWGVAPNSESKKHPFYGITHFKKGFGGYQKDLLHCQDYVLTKKYWFNWIIESLRRIRRGF
jgi:peptidoglycan pentaglycine glycine transferase (the first glycine)